MTKLVLKNSRVKILLFLAILLISAPLTHAESLRWAQKPLLVCLPPDPHSPVMKQAFTEWQKATKDKVTFNFLTANSCPNAHITVSYSPSKRKSLTSYSYNSKRYFLKAHIDIGLLTKEGQTNSPELLLPLMEHEVGHAIGLVGHTNTPQSVMQPEVKAGYKITQDSINEINRIYK